MRKIPRSALLLGLAGVLPFALAAFLAEFPAPEIGGEAYILVHPKDAPAILSAYGTVILCFMSGVLWGFAAKGPTERATRGYALSVVPALYAFFLTTRHLFGVKSDVAAIQFLIAGFIGVLALDYLFWKQGDAPPWWMALRGLLTGLVVFCLWIGLP
ncbi:DUF3429 domain-containing protein [Litoreibacter roseus]|uniref:Membrane protein n=1 Tax=Litoreibacter roseus TaxID=2601869 RepID=A0A6N6JJ53_9RHOB|nr:DUF3429 domain-containing protein [Litoreibacter roseus]GFE66393.1 membrane protein [Litoreibacter roseus]